MSQRLRAIVDDDAGEARRRNARSGSGRRCAAARRLSRRQHDRGRARRLRGRAHPLAGAARRADRGRGLDRRRWRPGRRRRRPTRPRWRSRSRRAASSAPAKRGAGFAGLIEWLLPRPRLAIATSALASFAIVAVGVDIALHTHPQFRQVIQSQSSPPGGPVAAPGRDIGHASGDASREHQDRPAGCRRRRSSAIRSC